jgi:hypothetical protein
VQGLGLGRRVLRNAAAAATITRLNLVLGARRDHLGELQEDEPFQLRREIRNFLYLER